MSDLVDGAAGVIVAPFRCCATCGAHYRSDFPRCPADGGEIHDVAVDPLLGSRALEPYAIDALLGEGSMGRVYRAHHARLPTKIYAVKVLRGDLATEPAMRLRFAKEAELASKLSHPNVITVHDFGRSKKGLLYLVMELVEGVSLTDVIAKGPVAPAVAVRYARGIAEGLAYAHAQGVIHRDLKPDNVLVVDDTPRIVDFGIAISNDPNDARLTATGFTLGTPGYLSPESMVDGTVDHRADLYGLGVTLFEMLTGKLPFAGNAMKQMAAKATRSAPRMSERTTAVAVPEPLEDVVAKLLARRPGARYGSATDVIAALDRLGEDGSGTQRVGARRGRAAAIALGAVVVVVGAAIAVTVLSSRAEPPAREAAAATVTAPVTAAAPVREVAPDPAPDPAPSPAPAPAIVRPPPVAPAAPAEQKHRKHRDDAKDDKPATVPAPAPAPATVPVAATVSAPVPATAPAPAPAPAPPPAPLAVHLGHLTATGSIADGDVKRSLNRALPALRACAKVARAPATVSVHFTVGDNRRAANVEAAGGTPAVADCVAAAIRAVRTETAPDTGGASVSVSVEITR